MDGSNDKEPELIGSYSDLEKQKKLSQEVSGQSLEQNVPQSTIQQQSSASVVNSNVPNQDNMSVVTNDINIQHEVNETQVADQNSVDFEKKPAGIMVRASANLFDGLITGLIPFWIYLFNLIFTGVRIGGNYTVQYGVALLSFLLGIGYSIYFLEKSGATPGKEIHGIKVIDIEGGETISYKKATIRQLSNLGLASIPLLGTLFLIINFFVIIFSEEKKGIHDRIAKTKAIINNKQWPIAKQLGLFVLLIILYIIPSILVAPRIFRESQKNSECLAQCYQDKLKLEPETDPTELLENCSYLCASND